MTTYFEFLMQRPVKQRCHDVGQPPVHRRRNGPTRAELGFGKERSAKAAKLFEILDGKLNQTTKALIANGKPVNPNTVPAAQRANDTTLSGTADATGFCATRRPSAVAMPSSNL
jgi:hypothetical protein